MMNNPIEDELDMIRLALYEQTRDMSASEVTAYIKKQIAPTLEKYSMPASVAAKSAQSVRRDDGARMRA
jgi:hypothetical protein